MHRFSKLPDEGVIKLPHDLCSYANIRKDVAIIGMIYHAEVHDKKDYLEDLRSENTEDRLAMFRKIRFN